MKRVNRVRRNGDGGPWTFPATPVRRPQANRRCNFSAKGARGWMPNANVSGEPAWAARFDRPARQPAIGHRCRVRLRLGRWPTGDGPRCASMLVAGAWWVELESFASVSIHRSDRPPPPPCSSSATTVTATSPPRTRRDARKATRSFEGPWWPFSRRGSCNRVIIHV